MSVFAGIYTHFCVKFSSFSDLKLRPQKLHIIHAYNLSYMQLCGSKMVDFVPKSASISGKNGI